MTDLHFTFSTVDIIIPVYNEEEMLPLFHGMLCETVDALPHSFTFYYINDGSTDGTAAALERLRAGDTRVVIVEFSRNFGHQAALTAGLDRAEGDLVITMDCDGQHPPALIAEMISLARLGYDIVITQRQEPESLSFLKRLSSALFYRLINWIGDTHILPGGADFRLMNRTVVLALRSMREYNRFLRGMVAWMGFRTVILPYQQPPRLAGTSKYSTRKMFRLAANAVFSFSLVPLYISMSLGGIFLILALAQALWVFSLWLRGASDQLVPGWSSMMFILLIVGGILMISVGLVGVYTGYIFQEIKHRPVYLVRRETEKKPTADEKTIADPNG
ncbi:MAG: glycosyltransferase family 2 protein [Anaerolineaceae bacterium]|nr:glycosyltransferase family 2 protein [Anaerolineaceae bacterium]